MRTQFSAFHYANVRNAMVQSRRPEGDVRLQVGSLLNGVQVGAEDRRQVRTPEYQQVPEAV